MNQRIVILALLLGGLIMFATRKVWAVPLKGMKYAPLFQSAEYRYGLPDRLLARMAKQESNYDPNATNPSGAQGIMQIIPRWHPTAGDPFDPVQAIPYAGSYMRRLYNRFGNWGQALAGYNMGPTALAKVIANHGVEWIFNLPEETREYVVEIGGDVGVA